MQIMVCKIQPKGQASSLILEPETHAAARHRPRKRKKPRSVFDFLITVLKIAIISLIVGAGLSFVNITGADILGVVGLSPVEVWLYVLEFWDWAVPNMILGAFIVVPAWLLIFLFTPPRA